MDSIRLLLRRPGAVFLTATGLAVVLVAAMPWLANRYLLYILLTAALTLISVVGLNLLMGYAGLISIGTAAFSMAGGYASAILMTTHHQSAWVAIPVAMVVCAFIGLVAGWPALRLGGFAVAAVTIAFGLVAASTVLYFSSFTGGGDGIAAQPTGLVLGVQWWIVAVLALLAVLLHRNLILSPLGRSLELGRLSVPLAESLGIPTRRRKLAIFVLYSVLAGLSGAFHPFINGRTTVDSFPIDLSVTVLLMVVIGGEGTVIGPVVGVALITGIKYALDNIFRSGGSVSVLVYGAILLLTVVLVPNGVAGAVASAIRRRRATSPRTAAQVAEAIGGDGTVAPGRQALVEMLRPDSPPETVVADDVAIRLGGVRALDGASLTIRPGTVHALIGPNGSGKTTMLNCISGALVPDSGRLRLGDAPMPRAPHARGRAGLSRTYQAPLLIEDKTALQNVVFGVDAHRKVAFLSYILRLGSARREAREAVDQARRWLAAVELTAVEDTEAKHLPPGKRRLLEIARALATKPRVVLLDEPAAGLSGAELDDLVAIIRAIREAGVSVLLVEHHADLVMALSDEVTVLERGAVIASGAPDEVKRDPRVIAAYLGDELEVRT